MNTDRKPREELNRELPRKPLEELIREVPPEQEQELRELLERLLSQRTSNASSTVEGHGEREGVRRYFGAWDSGDENSADNDLIDDDMAREYGSVHEAEN
jgi:hypothetical protein